MGEDLVIASRAPTAVIHIATACMQHHPVIGCCWTSHAPEAKNAPHTVRLLTKTVRRWVRVIRRVSRSRGGASSGTHYLPELQRVRSIPPQHSSFARWRPAHRFAPLDMRRVDERGPVHPERHVRRA